MGALESSVVSGAQRLSGSVGMFETRAWTHKSWLPLAVLWGSAASQILIKTGEKGELPHLEQLPCCHCQVVLLRWSFATTVFP